MEDKEAIGVLKGLLAKGTLSAEEAEAVGISIRTLLLMVHTSEGYLKQLKAKKEKKSRELEY